MPYNNLKMSAEILNDIISNEKINKSMGLAAKNLAMKYFSVDVQYPVFEKVITSTLKNK